MTANVHSLLHLADAVENIGPLYISSCFGFETLNGQILGMSKGTRGISSQIVHAIDMIQLIPSYVNEYIDLHTETGSLYKLISNNFSNGPYNCNHKELVEGEIYALGCPQQIELDSLLMSKLHSFTGCICSTYHILLCTCTVDYCSFTSI